jgi:hypothetical protein
MLVQCTAFFTLYFSCIVLITCSVRNDSSIHNVYNISTKIEIASLFRWGYDVTNVKTGNEEKEPRGSDGRGDGRGGGKVSTTEYIHILVEMKQVQCICHTARIPSPLPLRVAKTSRNHLNEEFTPLLPTGIGERV